MERFLTVKEMAELLNVSPRTLRREARAGRIPFITVGREYRFRVDHVLSSLAANMRTGSCRAAVELGSDTHLSDEAPAVAQQNRPRPAGLEDGHPAPANSRAMAV